MAIKSGLRRAAGAFVGVFLLPAAASSTAEAEDAWPMPGQNFAGFRYSELDQINPENVAQLTVAWTFFASPDFSQPEGWAGVWPVRTDEVGGRGGFGSRVRV